MDQLAKYIKKLPTVASLHVTAVLNYRHMGIMWVSVAKKSAVNLKVKHGKGTHHKPRFKNDSIWTFGRFLTAFQDIE